MRGHGAHMWICGAMMVAALIIVLVPESGLVFLPVLGCLLMMAVVVQMIGGMGGHDRGNDPR